MDASQAILLAAAALPPAYALDFTVIGDWGGMPFWPYYTPGEKATAAAVGKVAGAVNSSFTLALGDNVSFPALTQDYTHA